MSERPRCCVRNAQAPSCYLIASYAVMVDHKAWYAEHISTKLHIHNAAQKLATTCPRKSQQPRLYRLRLLQKQLQLYRMYQVNLIRFICRPCKRICHPNGSLEIIWTCMSTCRHLLQEMFSAHEPSIVISRISSGRTLLLEIGRSLESRSMM